MDFTEKHEQMLQETHDVVIKLKTVILDSDGHKGLASQVNDVCSSHYRLRRNFWLLIGILAGSGIITGTVLGVFNGG